MSCQNLVPLFGSVVTGAAAFLGVVLSNRSNFNRMKLENEMEASRRRIDLHRDRGEELYMVVDKWLTGFGMNGISLISVMRGKISYNQYLDIRLNPDNKPDYDFTRVEMIIDVYFPQVRPFYDQVTEARAVANEISAAHKREYEVGNTDGQAFINPFIEAQENFAAAGERLKDQIKQCLKAV